MKAAMSLPAFSAFPVVQVLSRFSPLPLSRTVSIMHTPARRPSDKPGLYWKGSQQYQCCG